MNVSSLITKDYRKKYDFAVPKNKPNSNPISSKAKMNVSLYVIKEYENDTTSGSGKNKPNPLPPWLECCLPPWFSLKLTPKNAPNF
jgi:hypothetical protein